MTDVANVVSGELTTTGERDGRVSERTVAAIEAGIPENTRRAYARRWAEFSAWCHRELRTALPATAETLVEYVAELTGSAETSGVFTSPDSVAQAIAAIRVRHRDAGYDGQPATKPALTALRGYRRRWTDAGHRKRQAPPINVHDLHAMTTSTTRATTTGKRDRLLLVLGWSIAARRSELVALNVGDVFEREDGQGVTVRVRYSKTDKDAVGREVPVWAGSYPDTDVVRLLRAWRSELDAYGVSDGRLFRSVDRWGNLGDSLSAGVVTRIIRDAARRAMLPNLERFSAHSLRAGFATTAIRNRAPLAAVADQGGWSQSSPVLMGYVRARDAWEDNPTRNIGL